MKFLLLMLLYKRLSCENSCEGDKPTKLPDKSCGSFNDVCLKKDDKTCNNLQQACKQCPPTNYTILMLKEINKGYKSIRQELSNGSKVLSQFVLTMNSLHSSQNVIKNDPIVVLTFSFLIVNIFLNILLHVERRSKFIRRLTGFNLKSRKYDIIKNLPLNDNQECVSIELNDRMNKNESEIKSKKNKIESAENLTSFEKRLNDRLDEFKSGIESIKNKLEITETTSRAMKFKIEGTCFDLFVSPDDNVVIIKRQICAKLVFSEPGDFKRMEVQFNGCCIDDNEMLLRKVSNEYSELICNINKTKNPSAIVVLKINDNNWQRLIQIDEDKSLKDLKDIINPSNNIDNKILIFLSSSNKFDLIDDSKLNQNIKDLKITDNDYIRIIFEKPINLKLKSISNKVLINIKHSNVQTISSLKKQIGEELRCNPRNIVLFKDNYCLNDEKFIFEYEFKKDAIIHYCHFENCEKTEFKEIIDFKTTGQYKVFRANYSKIKKILMIKCYFNQNENLKNELITFKRTNEYNYMQNLTIALTFNQFHYICVEYKKSLEHILKESTERIDENKIGQWTRDILNGLNKFHELNISHPDLKASKIIIGKRDAKISLFGSLKNNPKYDNRGKFEESENYYQEKCKESEDVKNLGKILLDIINSKCYFPKNIENERRDLLTRNSNYEDRKDISKNLKDFLNNCLNYDANQSVNVEKLLIMEFVKWG